MLKPKTSVVKQYNSGGRENRNVGSIIVIRPSHCSHVASE